MTTAAADHGQNATEMPLPWEEEAFALGLDHAVKQLGQTGKVRPVLVALKCRDHPPTMLWDMEISSAVARGLEGMQELALIVNQLLSPTGCDLSGMGMPREHWKADGLLLVAEGFGAQVDGNAAREGGGPESAPTTRVLSLEYRVGGRSAVMLYRMDQRGATELQLNPMVKVPGKDTPLLMRPPSVQ